MVQEERPTPQNASCDYMCSSPGFHLLLSLDILYLYQIESSPSLSTCHLNFRALGRIAERRLDPGGTAAKRVIFRHQTP